MTSHCILPIMQAVLRGFVNCPTDDVAAEDEWGE